MNKAILFFATLFFAASAFATGHIHTTNSACEKSDGFYTPTVGMTEATKAKKFAGWKEATLDRDQCLQTVARENGADRKGHVRMQKGTKVLVSVSGDNVVIAECGNTIFTKVLFTLVTNEVPSSAREGKQNKELYAFCVTNRGQQCVKGPCVYEVEAPNNLPGACTKVVTNFERQNGGESHSSWVARAGKSVGHPGTYRDIPDNQ